MPSGRTTKPATPPKNQPTLQPGYWVALTLKPHTAPLRCYVGKVQGVDEHGVRLTLVDWVVGAAVNWDFFAPWESITSALIATPDHDVDNFGEAASNWQSRMDDRAKQDNSNQDTSAE